MQRHSTEAVLQAVRAVVARELSLARGFSRAKTARILGVTAPAISQYVSGKRGGELVAHIEHDKKQMETIQILSDDILQASGTRPDRTSMLLLKASERIASRLSSAGSEIQLPKTPSFTARAQWLTLLRKRLSEEQGAASGSLGFAQTCDDELMKTMFRQIASDSVRHADTVSVLINAIEKPGSFDVRLPSKEAVQKMIEAEEAADEADISSLKNRLGPAARLLIESIEADERKHVLLLKGLLRVIDESEKAKK